MRYGIFADIHGNLEALETVIKAYAKENIDQYVCAGDIVGYGSNPKKCLQLVKNLKAIVVAGNHDYAVCGLSDISHFSLPAREAVLWTKKQLVETELSYLSSLPLTITKEKFIVVHSSLNSPLDWHYITDKSSACQSFTSQETPLCFVGHSHVPGIFLEENRQIIASPQDKIKFKIGIKYIINVGSVGQPRDGNPKACYTVYDTETNLLEIKRMGYNLEITQEKIIKAGLPQILAERLAGGH